MWYVRVPTLYVVENKEVPDRNIGVPPVRKYAIYRTLGHATRPKSMCDIIIERVFFKVVI
jgi:hypothetical protein